VPTELFDVIATSIRTKEQRVLAVGKTKENAEAFCDMAVMRRGVEEEFFSVIPYGTCRNKAA